MKINEFIGIVGIIFTISSILYTFWSMIKQTKENN